MIFESSRKTHEIHVRGSFLDIPYPEDKSGNSEPYFMIFMISAKNRYFEAKNHE